MYRIIFSLGLGVAFMSFLPIILNAADIREGSIDDTPQGKIVGQGTGIAGQQSFRPIVRTDRDLRDRNPARYQGNVARYAGQYGSYYNTPGTYGGYPTSAYETYYYGYPSSTSYGPSYGTYDYNYPSYPSYSPYPVYPNTYYRYPGYRAYDYNPGMYNPNTTFVNPPSSLNYPTGYPVYSETYNYQK